MSTAPGQAAARSRAMSDADLEAVARNEATCHPDPWDLAMLRGSLIHGHVCRVLVREDRLLGHGILRVTPPEAEILNLCIHPDEWGRGHGRALLRELLDRARLGGAAEVYLEVRESNRRARRLYAREGFHQVGQRPDYYVTPAGREDALIMGCHLGGGGDSDPSAKE